MKQWFFTHWSHEQIRDDQSLTMKVVLDPELMGGLKDHVFGGQCLFPFALTANLLLEGAANLHGSESLYPLHIDFMEQYRGIVIPFGETREVTIEARYIDDSTIAVTVFTPLMNKAGKVIRERGKVADMQVKLGQGDSRELSRFAPRQCQQIRMPQGEYYHKVHHTHGPLFRTVTGEYFLAQESNGVSGVFNIYQHEDLMSVEPKLPFVLSPLALDSVLQMVVLNCLLEESDNDQPYNTKLPVRIEEVVVTSPFAQDCQYILDGRILSSDEVDLVCSCQIRSREGDELNSQFGRVVVRRAPFEKREPMDLYGIFASFAEGEVAV
uniref:polyketide synthase dehydratase domain-containing protein n=1 Tax=Thaumasiovibrio occultus TaxID=1891184 RepID=UPI000B35AA94|nr:polyketide synthase dehydratase domain-containing protein [Thaumasiovibrio occultus]